MELFHWEKSLSVGIDKIDQQHQKLVKLLNDLFDAMGQGKGKDILKSILTDLAKYTIEHFNSEEIFMNINRFPELEIHKKEHKMFVDKLTEFKTKFEKGDLHVTIDLVDFLKNWLVKHITDEDKKYGEHFKKRTEVDIEED